MTWTREHDRTLAEKCERLKVRRWDELPIAQQHYDYCPDELFIGESIHDKLPRYNTDIAACIRAVKAWRVQKPRRSYVIYSQTGGHPPVVFLIEAGETIGRAEHLHEALYEAVTR